MPRPSRAKPIGPLRPAAAAILGIAPAWPNLGELRVMTARIAGQLSRAVRSAFERRPSAGPKQSAETWLDHMSDHLLRDIGASRMEITYGTHQGGTRQGGTDVRDTPTGQAASSAASHSPRLKVMMRKGSPSRQARSRTIRGARTTRR
jgi:hypothetical protein